MVPIVAGLSALHERASCTAIWRRECLSRLSSPREREPKLLDFGISRALGGDKLRRASGTRGIFRGSALVLVARGSERRQKRRRCRISIRWASCSTSVPSARTRSSRTAAAESVRRIIQGEYPPLSQHEARPSEALVRIVERAMSLDPDSAIRISRRSGGIY